jgi:hypothetical protein
MEHLPIPKPTAPMAVHNLVPTTPTFAPTTETVFQDEAAAPSACPQCSTIKANALSPQFMGTMFGQDFCFAVTVAPAQVPVAPPTVAVEDLHQLNPFIQMPLSVAASNHVPTTILDFSSFALPRSLPWFPIFAQYIPGP